MYIETFARIALRSLLRRMNKESSVKVNPNNERHPDQT